MSDHCAAAMHVHAIQQHGLVVGLEGKGLCSFCIFPNRHPIYSDGFVYDFHNLRINSYSILQ